nr:hypothetical protein BaRGS_007828 [Batillaria attramentaria]
MSNALPFGYPGSPPQTDQRLHPLGLCNSNDYDELYDYGWVGVVKLERPELEPEPCLSVFGKAKRALQRGATAVVLDITDNPVAAEALSDTTDTLGRPVIVMRGPDAAKLMGIVNTQSEARIRIIYSPDEEQEAEAEITRKEYFGMGIFVAVFLLFCLICVIVMLKLKFRNRERQLSVSNLAKRMISQLGTRKYEQTYPKRLHVQHSPNSDTSVHSSISESCAICLEGYREGQLTRSGFDSVSAHIQLAPDDDEDVDEGDENQMSEAAGGADLHHDVLDLDHEHDHPRNASRFSLLPPPSIAPSQRSFRSNPYSLPLPLPHTDCASLHMYSSGQRRLVRTTTCPSCESTHGSSHSSAGSYFREAAASAAALSLARCGSNCSHAREYSNPLQREYSSGSAAGQRGGAAVGRDYSGSCEIRNFASNGGGGGSREPRESAPSSSYAGAHDLRSSAALLHEAIRTGCPNFPRQAPPLSPYLPHHSGIQFSPAVVSAHHLCSNDPFSCALHAASRGRVYHPPGHTVRLYAPVGPGGRVSCDSDAEKWGSLRSLSVTAVRGSSSSDPNPSDTSLECDCCCNSGGGGGRGGGGDHSNSDSAVIDSNRSTYGSSEPKDSSDVSSYDSRVYQARGSGSSADERECRRKKPSSSPRSSPGPLVRLRPSCMVRHKTTRDLQQQRQQLEVEPIQASGVVVVHDSVGYGLGQ